MESQTLKSLVRMDYYICKVSLDPEDIPFCNEKQFASKVDRAKWAFRSGG
jgi:hypothetical protein